MENYHKLSDATRTLEQQYTRLLAVEAAQRIRELSNEIAELKEKACAGEELQKEREKCAMLTRKISELSVEKEALEKRLQEAEAKSSKSDGFTGDAMKELKSKHEEALKLLKQISKKLEDTQKAPATTLEYQNRIKRLEEELEDERINKTTLQRSEKERRDSTILLKDMLESKEKTINAQKVEIERLLNENSKLRMPAAAGVIVPNVSVAGKEPEPWALQNIVEIKKPKTAVSKKAKNTKTVNVEKIMREDNENNFFNDLSFSNNSPSVDRTYKMNFK